MNPLVLWFMRQRMKTLPKGKLFHMMLLCNTNYCIAIVNAIFNVIDTGAVMWSRTARGKT